MQTFNDGRIDEPVALVLAEPNDAAGREDGGLENSGVVDVSLGVAIARRHRDDAFRVSDDAVTRVNERQEDRLSPLSSILSNVFFCVTDAAEK
jgi:hypothetical protein